MKLIADENVDRPIVQWLRDRGADVSWMAERAPGSDDSSIAAVALLEDRVLITFDRDFGELVFRHGTRLAGVLYIRLRMRDPALLVSAFQRVWPVVEPKLHGNFVVVSRGRVRIRALAPR